MEGDLGAAQQAIKEMAHEAGLAFFKAVTDKHIPEAYNKETKVDLWNAQISPLFRLITHPRLVNSNMLELEVSSIYSFIVGVNASRLIRVFDLVIDLAQIWKEEITDTPLTPALELSLSVLSKAVDCSTTNIINEHLHRIVEQFSSLMEGQAGNVNDLVVLQAKKYLEYLQRRLGFGKSLVEPKEIRQPILTHETFTLRKDLPGRLSADGPRHNNDHEEIAEISIMPTYEEVMSPRNEYLPVTDSSQWHLEGIRGRLDREFRLLREDTVGQLRDAARDMFESIRGRDQKDTRWPQKGARTCSYNDAVVNNITLDQNNGLELTLRCKQPDLVRNKSDRYRHEWWEKSKRLQAGALTCVLDARGMLQFFVVAESTLRVEPVEKKTNTPQDDQQVNQVPNRFTLSSDPSCLFVNLNLVDTSPASVTEVFRWYRDIRSASPRHLVEFPGVLLASFKHTLEALQELSKKPDLPFASLIAPDKPEKNPEVVVLPPLFARSPGYQYTLTCLAKDGKPFQIKTRQPPSAEEVAEKTGLDLTQSQSLINTLGREVSLIQGPPGTGKSYTGEKLIQGLLGNKTKAQLGPIICVCYTNHALDQLLEHLLDAGIDGVIRMGSRSKSERLQDLNLRIISKDMELTKAEKHEYHIYRTEQKDRQEEINVLLNRLKNFDSLASIRQNLHSNHRNHHDQLFGKGEDDKAWQEVRRRVRDPVRHWLYSANNIQHGQNTEPRAIHDLLHAKLETLTQPERLRLHRYWLAEIRDPIIRDIVHAHRAHAHAKKQRDLIREECRLRCLQQANIVGVTTTGMARDLHLLRKLRTKIVVCEEAGEVLEAHILTALLPSVQQLILIGDHLQLHPQIQNYELQSTNPRGVQYSLDVSLFERLVQPPHIGDIKLPVSVLETQRRMHPSIADMVRSTLYSSLKDGDNVKVYPEVVGVQRRLFWMNHQHLEAGAANDDPHNTSHSNDYEVEMTSAMVSHIVRQGTYLPDDIAVLTPYLGQLQKLRARMAAESTFAVDLGERDLEDLDAFNEKSPDGELSVKPPIAKTTLLRSVRLATVDNFQGEEAKIVIISLVRSNPQNRCGFLSTSNRINVLLSRAKEGCYIFGNDETYRHVPMWAQIIQLLQDGGNFGSSLALECPRHPQIPIFVSMPDDFATFSPDGGCNLPCDRRLNCGHACCGPCHSNLLHNAVKCPEKCPRPKKGCDHACPRACGDRCEDRCNVTLEDRQLVLPCGHVLKRPKCWQTQDPTLVRCTLPVKRKVPKCGHTIKLPCNVDVSLPDFKCNARCEAALECGHACLSLCFLCNTRENGEIVNTTHKACTQICGRKFTTCPHTCRQPCHGQANCAPCNAPCEVRCSHSRCSKPCHEPCAPCAEELCASRCPHARCSMPCAAPCDWVPCSKRCTLRLGCGHQCPSTCGEICPDKRYCQKCGSEEVLSMVVDFIEMAEYKDVDLDQDPCIFPDCGHMLTATSMDGQMSISDHYGLDSDGRPVSIATTSTPFSMDEIKVCASCRGPLRNISRYGRIVRRAMLDEATKKFMTWSNNKYHELSKRLLQAQDDMREHGNASEKSLVGEGSLRLDGKAADQVRRLDRLVGTRRYKTIRVVYLDIERFVSQVMIEEQPFQKVANLVRHANRSRELTSSFTFDESQLQFRGYLLATTLAVKCHLFMLTDFVQLLTNPLNRKEPIIIDFGHIKARCEEVIKLSIETQRPQHQAEGHIYYAQVCGLAVILESFSLGADKTMRAGNPVVPGEVTADPTEARRKEHQATGRSHIKSARALMTGRSWSTIPLMEAEIDKANMMLNEGVFYRPVTTDEIRAVYEAMARELRGTGHWYVCERGHPFTVGECGMPMEQARCYECGAPVGGSRHVSVQGVRHAVEIENLGRGVENLRI